MESFGSIIEEKCVLFAKKYLFFGRLSQPCSTRSAQLISTKISSAQLSSPHRKNDSAQFSSLISLKNYSAQLSSAQT